MSSMRREGICQLRNLSLIKSRTGWALEIISAVLLFTVQAGTPKSEIPVQEAPAVCWQSQGWISLARASGPIRGAILGCWVMLNRALQLWIAFCFFSMAFWNWEWHFGVASCDQLLKQIREALPWQSISGWSCPWGGVASQMVLRVPFFCFTLKM